MEWLSCICDNKMSKIYFGNNDGIALIIFFDRKPLSPPAILNCDSSQIQEFVRKVQGTFKFIFSINVYYFFFC